MNPIIIVLIVLAVVAIVALIVVRRNKIKQIHAAYFAAEEEKARIAKEREEQERLEREERTAQVAAEKQAAKQPAPKKKTVKKIEEPVEEEIPEEIEEKPLPKKKATKKTEKPVEEEAVSAVTKEKPAPKKTTRKSSKAQEVEETIAMVENMDEVDTAIQEDESEEESHSRYAGKWVICRVITDDEEDEDMYFFELRASNGEKLLVSEEYTTYQGAWRGIATHKANILKGNLKITLSKKGDYIFKLLSGKNMLLCMGENYPTKARCESAIESTKRFAETAIIDENVQDIVVKVPQDVEEDIIAPADEDYTGKWIISSKRSNLGEEIFFFELYANNGEKLLSSEEYTTYIGAVNGIQTHRKNIENNNFRITLTKRGDYIYKLLNGNGQLLCLGEHYRSKRLCQNAVESVRRFAANAPILTEEK